MRREIWIIISAALGFAPAAAFAEEARVRLSRVFGEAKTEVIGITTQDGKHYAPTVLRQPVTVTATLLTEDRLTPADVAQLLAQIQRCEDGYSENHADREIADGWEFTFDCITLHRR